MTILEGIVPQEMASRLKEKFERILKEKPDSIVKTYLIQDLKNTDIWRLITVWRSREALDEMRKQGTPAGVLVFRSVGAEPTLSIYEIQVQSGY